MVLHVLKPHTVTCELVPFGRHTFAPSLAKAIAEAFPMPVDAPVTSATFPSSLPAGMVILVVAPGTAGVEGSRNSAGGSGYHTLSRSDLDAERSTTPVDRATGALLAWG